MGDIFPSNRITFSLCNGHTTTFPPDSASSTTFHHHRVTELRTRGDRYKTSIILRRGGRHFRREKREKERYYRVSGKEAELRPVCTSDSPFCKNSIHLFHLSLFYEQKIYVNEILLTKKKSCIDHDSMKTINGKSFATYQVACYALRSLANDEEFIDTIKEISELASRNRLKKLLVTLLIMNTMSKPNVVWDSTWKLMADGILYKKRRRK